MELVRGGEEGATVYLQVYDLVDNSWLHSLGVGIYHSGVEIYGVEYAFGGHEYDAPGVFATHPRAAPGAAWREAIPIGHTSLSQAQVYELVQEMGREYKGNIYHLLQLNCNTFSADLCHRLTGRLPPSWVNRLASVAVSLHCLLPQGWVPPLRPPSMLPGAGMPLGGGGESDRQALLPDVMSPTEGRGRSAVPLAAGMEQRASM